MNAFIRAMDRLTGVLGKVISWFALAMVLIGAYNAIVRYLGRFMSTNLSSNLYLELQWYLFSLLFLLGAGYALREDAHVRVDVVYARCSRKTRAWINVVGTLVLLLPFSVFVLFVSWPSVRNSWSIKEMSPDPGGLPRYHLKAVILVCFILLIGQGVAELFKELAVLRADPPGSEGGDEPSGPGPLISDPDPPAAGGGGADHGRIRSGF